MQRTRRVGGRILPRDVSVFSCYPVIAGVALAAGSSAAKWAWVKQPEAGAHSTTTRPLPPCHVLCFLARVYVLF